MVLAVNGGQPGQSSTFIYILGALFVVGLGLSLYNKRLLALSQFLLEMNLRVRIDCI